MENIIYFLKSLVFIRLNRIITSILLFILLGALSNYYDWASYALWLPLSILIIEALILFAHAWVINPLRELKKKNEKN